MKLLTPMARTLPSARSVSRARYALERRLEVRGQGLVQDQQVDLVDAELAGALLEAVQRLVVAVVADPDLGLEEDLGAVQPGVADRLADLPFVAVCGGGVDVPVARGQGGRHGRPGLVRGGLEDPETDGRQGHPVVQGQRRDVRHEVAHFSRRSPSRQSWVGKSSESRSWRLRRPEWLATRPGASAGLRPRCRDRRCRRST